MKHLVPGSLLLVGGWMFAMTALLDMARLIALGICKNPSYFLRALKPANEVTAILCLVGALCMTLGVVWAVLLQPTAYQWITSKWFGKWLQVNGGKKPTSSDASKTPA